MFLHTKILFVLLWLTLNPAYAQPHLRWHEGDVTLSTGLTLHAGMCYQPQTNAIIVQTGDTWRTYTADQLQGFRYTDVALSYSHQFRVYETTGPDGQTVPLIFEILVPGQSLALLRLPGQHRANWLAQHGLLRCQRAGWQTPDYWFVWLEGHFAAPDAFVETGLDNLVAAAPESVQRWSANTARPNNPKALSLWLSRYNGRLVQAQNSDRPTITFWSVSH